jgi:hypothetical protein
MRTFGPSFANSLYSLTIEHGYMGGKMVWYALLLVGLAANGGGWFLPAHVWKREGEVD